MYRVYEEIEKNLIIDSEKYLEKLFGIIPIKKEYAYALATSLIASGLTALVAVI